MEDDNEGGRPLDVIGDKGEHPELAGIGPKALGFNQRAAQTRPQVSPKMPKAIDGAQLWQTPQEFDIVGKGHRQLLGARFV